MFKISIIKQYVSIEHEPQALLATLKYFWSNILLPFRRMICNNILNCSKRLNIVNAANNVKFIICYAYVDYEDLIKEVRGGC